MMRWDKNILLDTHTHTHVELNLMLDTERLAKVDTLKDCGWVVVIDCFLVRRGKRKKEKGEREREKKRERKK